MPERQVARFNLLNRLNLCGPLVRKWSTHCKCISTDNPPLRPDPAIYSQSHRFSQGMAANWMSPDIEANLWSRGRNTDWFGPDTETNLSGKWRVRDRIVVRVHNESNESSAVNTLVEVKWAPFGIGTTFTSFGAQIINLGPAPDATIMFFPINDDVRATGDDLSIQVNVSHPHDKNPDNNTGFHSFHGAFTSDVGRSPSIDFLVANASAVFETITLVVAQTKLAWTLTPASRVYAPNEQITATLSTVIPASITPPTDRYIEEFVTVMGYNSSGNLLGGLTVLVRIDS